MTTLFTKYRNTEKAIKDAENWNNLPKGRRYMGDSFKISLVHSKSPKLTRCGQQYEGGQNYWESPSELNQAILEVITNEWDFIYPLAMNKLKQQRDESLLALQSFIDDIQNKIDEIKNEDGDSE